MKANTSAAALPVNRYALRRRSRMTGSLGTVAEANPLNFASVTIEVPDEPAGNGTNGATGTNGADGGNGAHAATGDGAPAAAPEKV